MLMLIFSLQPLTMKQTANWTSSIHELPFRVLPRFHHSLFLHPHTFWQSSNPLGQKQFFLLSFNPIDLSAFRTAVASLHSILYCDSCFSQAPLNLLVFANCTLI